MHGFKNSTRMQVGHGEAATVARGNRVSAEEAGERKLIGRGPKPATSLSVRGLKNYDNAEPVAPRTPLDLRLSEPPRKK